MYKIVIISALLALAAARPELNHHCRGRPEGAVFVNPSNCNAYITCVGGHAIEQFCQTGLHFNERAHYCDYPENVNCKPGNPEPTPNPEQPESRPEPKCSNSNPQDPIKLPHEWDCAKFYVCDGGFAITMTCPLGTHWNKKQNFCDFPQSAGCQTRSRQLH